MADPLPLLGVLIEFFGTALQGLHARRGLKNTTLAAGAHNLTLLGEGGRIYPADYVIEEHSGGAQDSRATLTDQFLAETMERGESVLVTVIWPDPAPEADTVTIDVPDRFRASPTSR